MSTGFFVYEALSTALSTVQERFAFPLGKVALCGAAPHSAG